MHPYIEYLWNIVTIESMALFLVVYFVIVWIVLIVWVAQDIATRTNYKILWFFSVLLIIILTPLGILIYLLIRPGWNISKRCYREIEWNLDILNEIVQERIQQELLFCPHCDDVIESDFIVCPSCRKKLKHSCHSCKKEIQDDWKVCPYCETKQKKKHKKKTD